MSSFCSPIFNNVHLERVCLLNGLLLYYGSEHDDILRV